MMVLTYFVQLTFFHTPWKQKTRGGGWKRNWGLTKGGLVRKWWRKNKGMLWPSRKLWWVFKETSGMKWFNNLVHDISVTSYWISYWYVIWCLVRPFSWVQVNKLIVKTFWTVIFSKWIPWKDVSQKKCFWKNVSGDNKRYLNALQGASNSTVSLLWFENGWVFLLFLLWLFISEAWIFHAFLSFSR